MQPRQRRFLSIVVGVVIVGFIVLQVIPFKQRTNPPVTLQIAWDSPQTETLVRNACFDCHSNETRWPWYSAIAPVRWLLVDHVEDGRDAMNFSTGDLELDEIVKEIESGAMPPAYYTPLHPEANLTSTQRGQLIAGLRASLANLPGGEGEREGDGDED